MAEKQKVLSSQSSFSLRAAHLLAFSSKMSRQITFAVHSWQLLPFLPCGIFYLQICFGHAFLKPVSVWDAHHVSKQTCFACCCLLSLVSSIFSGRDRCVLEVQQNVLGSPTQSVFRDKSSVLLTEVSASYESHDFRFHKNKRDLRLILIPF